MYTEMRIQSLYFSATGTTKKIISTIEKHTDLRSELPIDLTLPKQREAFTGKVMGDIILVGVPVYHGTMPLPIMEPLNRLEGKGKWAVPVVVYGNRSAETCMDELAKILRDRGFKILAAASFVAEHSIASKEHPWGLGRPDQSDLEIAAKFGEQIKEKLCSGPSEIQTGDRFLDFLASARTNFSTIVMVESFPEGYHAKLAHWINGVTTVAFSKDADCAECMICLNVCPTGALKVASKEINEDLCIRCMACTHACPTGALSFQYIDSPLSNAVVAAVDKACADRKEPKIYV
jgi:ferredoxin